MVAKFLDLEKVTIRLRAGTRELLTKRYPNTAYNEVIRKIVEAHLKAIDQRGQDLIDHLRKTTAVKKDEQR